MCIVGRLALCLKHVCDSTLQLTLSFELWHFATL